jgi:hypothetical protein
LPYLTSNPGENVNLITADEKPCSSAEFLEVVFFVLQSALQQQLEALPTQTDTPIATS